MSGEQKMGLYNKYEVRRTDGSSRPGEKHEQCRHFVLDLVHDPFAKPAILAYAKACQKTHPVLAQDLREMALHFSFSGGRTGITPRCIGPTADGRGRCGKLHKNQKGWTFVSIRPIEGWICPVCRAKIERALRVLPKNGWKLQAFASTKSKDGIFPI